MQSLGFSASAFAGTSQAVLNGKSAVAPAAGRGALQVRAQDVLDRRSARRSAAPARAHWPATLMPAAARGRPPRRRAASPH
jgi:hypothetical protein